MTCDIQAMDVSFQPTIFPAGAGTVSVLPSFSFESHADAVASHDLVFARRQLYWVRRQTMYLGRYIVRSLIQIVPFLGRMTLIQWQSQELVLSPFSMYKH